MVGNAHPTKGVNQTTNNQHFDYAVPERSRRAVQATNNQKTLILILIIGNCYNCDMRKILISLVVAMSVAGGAFWFYPRQGKTSVDSQQSIIPPTYTYRIVNVYPHDQNAFTQGLVYHNGELYESTGLRGKSSLRRVELTTGKVLQIHKLNSSYFGEGIALYQDKIVQLTWKAGVGFVYNGETFEQISQFKYPTEGWGITYDGQRLIMSDGSDTLYFLDPETLAEIGRIQVVDRGTPIVRLNELEYIKGEIFANIWQTDLIARISPETGQVVGWIDLKGLLDRPAVIATGHRPDVLNGIAYDEEGHRLFVTGKLWPQLFEIELEQNK